MESPVLGCDLREETLLPCYFFFGEETYPAEEFVGQVRELLTASREEEFHLERFYLDETGWTEIVDTARTAPFLFHNWRVIVARLPERKSGSERGSGRKGGRGEGGKGIRFLSAADQKILREYFQEPAPRTVLVVIQPGKVRRDDAVVRFFSSLPKAAVLAKEVKPPTAYQAMKWADRKALSLGKALSGEAKSRLFDIIGPDLRLLANELEKLAVYTGDRKGIDLADVDSVTAWVRNFEAYELDDVLVSGDCDKGLAVLNSLFTEGVEPEQVVGRLAAFFQNVLFAKVWLGGKCRSRKDIFAEFFPRIKESYQDLYRRKFESFFAVVDGLSAPDLNAVLAGLQRVDWKIKTTDGNAETALEAFLKEYCALMMGKRPISRG